MAAVTADRSLNVRGNTLTPYLRVRMASLGHGVVVNWTESLLGLIPLRRRTFTLPDSRSARLKPRLFPERLAAAVGLLLLVVFDLASAPWVRITIGVMAGALLVLSLVMVLHLPDGKGGVHIVPVCWLERRRIAAFLGGPS